MEVPQTYLDRIRASFPNLALDRVEFNKDGLANEVVIVNRQRIFRFPKNEWAKTALHNEARMLELARKHVEVRLPVFDLLQEDMASYEFIPGEALLQGDILRHQGNATQDALAETLALFLAQLHSVPQTALDQYDVPISDTVRAPEQWLKLHEDVQQTLFPC